VTTVLVVTPEGAQEVPLPEDGQWLHVRPDGTWGIAPGYPDHAQIKAGLDGGWLEAVVGSLLPLLAYVDEEGKLKNLPANPLASAILGQPIVGPAVILTLADVSFHEGTFAEA
jgi:hypothetical protein